MCQSVCFYSQSDSGKTKLSDKEKGNRSNNGAAVIKKIITPTLQGTRRNKQTQRKTEKNGREMSVSNNDTVTALVYIANNSVSASWSRRAELLPRKTLLQPFFLKSPRGATLSSCLPHCSAPGRQGSGWRVCGESQWWFHTGCFKDRLMGAMRAGRTEGGRGLVFKECLSGEERLSYGAWWRLDTPRTAPGWMMGV